jgi:anion transporter
MESLVSSLRTLPLFAGLPREVLARLVGELEEVAVPAGVTLFARGEPGDAMYIVITGTLEVRFSEEGWEERLRVVGPGEWFGEMALLTGDPRSATAVALSGSRLWRLDKNRFLSLSEQQPTLLREVTRVLCRRLAQTFEDVSRARHAYAEAFESAMAACDLQDRQLLFRVAVAERPALAVFETLLGSASVRDRLESLARRHPMLLQAEDGGTYAIHPQFREYLLEVFQRETETGEIARLHLDLAKIYEARGEWREAVSHRLGAQDWPAAIRLLREVIASPDRPADEDMAPCLGRLPEAILLAEPDLVRMMADLLTRGGKGEAALALYRRAIATAPEAGAVRERLVRDLAEEYVVQGKVEQALEALRDVAADDSDEAAASAALHATVAARHLAAGRGSEAFAWARSARALSRGLREAMASPLRRLRLFQGWKGLAIALCVGSLVMAAPPASLSPPAAGLLATLVAAGVLWVGAGPPDFVVALGMGVAWVLLGVAPARDAFAGFANSTWFLILGILALGGALGRSGLLYRITLLILRRLPPTYTGQVLALGLSGALSTLLVPSVQGRVALVGPILAGLADGLGHPARSRGSAGLAFAALLGFSLMTTLFLTGTATCLLAWGMLPEATRMEITWGRWFFGVLPLEILTFLGTAGWIVWRYRPEEVRPSRPGIVDAQLEALGRPSRQEWTTAALGAALLIGWLTQGLHGVDPAWIAVAGLCVLLGAGILDRQALRTEVDWPFLLFMGMVFSLADLTGKVGADVWFGRVVSRILGGAAANPVAALCAAVLITVGVRFLLPWQTAVPLLTVALTPFALGAGLSPWIAALIALKAGNIFLLPYQSPYYLTLYYGTEERAFTHAQARPFAWAYLAVVLAAFLLSLPYWRLLGLA